MLVAHWLACIWYSIGRSDADNGVSMMWHVNDIYEDGRIGNEKKKKKKKIRSSMPLHFEYLNRCNTAGFGNWPM